MTVIITRMSEEMRARRIRMGMMPAPVVMPPPVVIAEPEPEPEPEFIRVMQLQRPRSTKAERIMRRVCKLHRITKAELCGQQRHSKLVRARQDYCYLMRRWTIFSLPQIGRMLGDRDHSTIIHAANKCAARRNRVIDVRGLFRTAKPEQGPASPDTPNPGAQVSFREAAE